MNKTILIGHNNKFSAYANKWLFILMGILFLVNGGLNISYYPQEILRPLFGILTLMSGIFYFFYGLIGFSVNSKYSLKVKVDKSTIELKNSLWKASTKLNWSDISSIQFQPFEVIFGLKDTSNSFSYASNADVSIEIKQTLREFAESRGIEVIGG